MVRDGHQSIFSFASLNPIARFFHRMDDHPTQTMQEEEANWNFAVTLPDRGDEIDKTTVKGSQFQKPYLEFSLLVSVKKGGLTGSTSF